MLLWDLIRDFFVQNIFGGYDSNLDTYSGLIGYGVDSGTNVDLYTNDFNVKLEGFVDTADGISYKLPLGDYLSTTFTIITLILLVIVLFIFVKWIFKLFAGLLYR